MFPVSRNVIVASTAFAAVLFAAAPLDAQRRPSRQGGSEPTAEPAQAQARNRAEKREQAPPPPSQPQQQRQEPRSAPQSAPPARQQESPRRGDDARTPPQQGRVSREAPSPRNGNGPQGSSQSSQSQRGYSTSSRAVPYGGYSGYGRRPVQVRRPVFVQPYYSFRSRLTLGFGLHVGYSVAYPFQHYDPYGFYNYRSVAPVYGPSARSYGSSYYYNRVGGLSFDIDPYDAAVFIDGEYVGVADDFASDQMPLTMGAGRHRVELRAQGFMPVSFEITVIAGQVIPYEGTLPYLR